MKIPKFLRNLTRKQLVVAGGVLLVGVVVLVVTVTILTEASTAQQYSTVTDRVVSRISAQNIKENTRFFAAEPHAAGSARNSFLGAEIKKRWEEWGFDQVLLNEYEVLLSLPLNESYIKYGGTVQYKPQYNQSFIPPYNAFSKSATVKGKVVFVNYGRVEDFEELSATLVDVTGCIAIARYGKIFRGSKAQNAFNNGMVGMILYSDPEDKGKGQVYPEGFWLPESGVERGNVKTVKGDISTHLFPSYKGGYHTSGEELAKIAPKIPVIPIPFTDAKPILNLCNDSPLAPTGWANYHTGPSREILELNVKNNDTLGPCENIIGVIHGAIEPDRWVIIGGHRDAWIHGASDPVSGVSIVMEIARSLGEELKTGWRPRRSIIFASWDVEEPGIIGSYEFAEDYASELGLKAVAYLNLDTAVNTPRMLSIKSTPNMNSLIYRAAKNTSSPTSNYTDLYQFWVKKQEKFSKKDVTGDPMIKLIGSGSDYTAFLNELGISCIDFQYSPDYGTYPVYHTQYDNVEWMEKFGDPDYIYHKTLGEFVTRVLIALSEDILLPMSALDYAKKIHGLVNSLNSSVSGILNDNNISFAHLHEASAEFLGKSEEFQTYLKANTDYSELPLMLRSINDRLSSLERKFLYLPGLPGRPSFRHLVFAPSSTDTYAGSAFPGVSDAIADAKDTAEWNEVEKQITLAVWKIKSAARSLSFDEL